MYANLKINSGQIDDSIKIDQAYTTTILAELFSPAC